MRAPFLLVPALLALAAPAARAEAPAAVVEVIPDPLLLPPAVVAWVNPLAVAADVPARLVERPALGDLETRASLLVAVRLDENGHVLEGQAVEPPLQALAPVAAQLAPKWTFTAAQKDGQTVKTWATCGLDLAVDLEDPALSAFDLAPVAPGDPAPLLGPDPVDERWMARYPRDPEPREPDLVSIEAVDFLPMPDRLSWKVESTRLRSRVSLLVAVTAKGQVRRLVPLGTGNEPLVVRWFRRSAQGWKLTPAQKGGVPVDSWATLDATVDYTLASAKESGRRSVQKNLRGVPRS